MADPAEVLEPFVCPRCTSTPLATTPGALRCPACGTEYPSIGGIPCLVDDPPLWRALWKSRLDDYLAATRVRLGALEREANTPNLLSSTRERIGRVVGALEADRRTFEKLFASLVPNAAAALPALLPADPQLSDPALIKYTEHLFRDWVWGEKENESALGLVRRLASKPLGKVAIYGVGTGRLALDVQRVFAPERTYGFDVNPLPLLATLHLLSGQELELHEFPLAPHAGDSVVVRHRLRAPQALPGTVSLAFADALRPPLAPDSLDTVITPWFIDAVTADVRETAAAVNRALRPGGFWLNYGPLRFEGPLSRRYLVDEVHEIVEASSFELNARFSDDVPYFHSPHSGTARIDRVFAFAAKKIGAAPALPSPPLFAPWLSDTNLPVPAAPGLAALKKNSVLTVGIVSMIDGRHSIRDLAVALAAQWGVPASVLEDQLRAFLARLPFE